MVEAARARTEKFFETAQVLPSWPMMTAAANLLVPMMLLSTYACHDMVALRPVPTDPCPQRRLRQDVSQHRDSH